MMGALLGAVLAAAVIVLLALLDTRIKDESDVEEMFELPILGSIPNFDSKHHGKHQEEKYA
jgi:capsular polysaccharide biosynthesis protein